MDPLSVVERYLGAVETWPTITLRYLFVEEPTQRRILVVTKYLYLNNVPVDEAVQCFTKCNGGHSEYVAATVRELYNLFRPNMQKPAFRQFGIEPGILQLIIANVREGRSNERPN